MTRSPGKDAAKYRIHPQRFLGCYRYVRLRWRLMFAAIDALGWMLFGPGKLLMAAARGKRRPLEHQASEIQRILLIQLDHLGDAILSTGLVSALAQRYPGSKIDVLAAPWSVAIFRLTGQVRRVRALKENRFSAARGWRWIAALVRCGWQLRRQRYDLVLDVRGEFPHAVLMWLTGAKRRLGWNCGGGGFLLTDSVPYHRGRHEVLSRLAMLRTLFPAATEDELAPRLRPTARTVAATEEQLLAHGIASKPAVVDPMQAALQVGAGPLVVMHVGAGTATKRWPAWHWRELLGRLIVRHNASVILVGTDHDRAIAQQVLAGGALQGVADWTGKLKLHALAALLQRADLLIGADSGPAHLAAAVGTPVVAIFSGTNNPHQWSPWGTEVELVRNQPACSPCHRQSCPLADHPCMVGVQPESVAQAAARWLPLVDMVEPNQPVPIEAWERQGALVGFTKSSNRRFRIDPAPGSTPPPPTSTQSLGVAAARELPSVGHDLQPSHPAEARQA